MAKPAPPLFSPWYLCQLLCVLSLALFLCFFDLNKPSFEKRDEITHVLISQEMKASANWWNPSLYGRPYFKKPPLNAWLTQVALLTLGESKSAYRVVSAGAGLLLALLLFVFARALFATLFSGTLAALCLLGFPALLFDHGLRAATPDGLLLFLFTAALWSGWHFIRQSTSAFPSYTGSGLYALLCGSFVGLSVLTKSVVGFIPLLILGAYCIASLNLSVYLRQVKMYLLLLLTVSLLLPAIYILPHCVISEQACSVMFFQEIFVRATTGFHNLESPWFYFQGVFQQRLLGAPLLFVFALLYGLYRTTRDKSESHRFLVIWIVMILVLIHLSRSRLFHYLYLLLPAMALLVGDAIDRAVKEVYRHHRHATGLLSARLLNTLVFLFYLTYAVTGNMITSIQTLRSLPAPMPADTLFSTLARRHQEEPSLQIVFFRQPGFSLTELPHAGMVKPAGYSLRSKKKLEERIRNSGTLIVIGNSHDLKQYMSTAHTVQSLPAHSGRQYPLTIAEFRNS